MKKFVTSEVSAKVFGLTISLCLMAVAFLFACGFGDETAPLMRNPTSGKISSPCNFIGAVTINGEELVGTTGSASITTLGTIDTGVWNATAIGVAYGGTGAGTAAAARTALGCASIYTGAFSALPVTTAKTKGDLYISNEGNAYICVSIGADTSGWKVINN